MQHGDVLAYAETKNVFQSKGDTLIFIAPPFVADSFNFGTNAAMTENKLRKCLGNQQKITLQIRPNEQRDAASV